MIGDEPSSDLAALVVPQTGRLVATGDRYEPCRLVDAGGVAVAAVTAYFRDLLAAGRAESTVRSYGMEDQPGDSWQDRWLASGADSAGREWREVPAAWLHARGQYSGARLARLSAARLTVICADTVRPSTGWFTGAVMRGGHLSLGMQATRDTEGFARLRELCDRDPRVSAGARAHVLHRAAVIIGAKGSLLRQITVGDVMELLDAEASAHANPMAHGSGFYRMLHRMGIFEAAAPQMLRELTASRQRTPGELIDRYDLAGPSVTCWWTTSRSGSRRWITAACGSFPPPWPAGSGKTLNATTPASAACTCPRKCPKPPAGSRRTPRPARRPGGPAPRGLRQRRRVRACET